MRNGSIVSEPKETLPCPLGSFGPVPETPMCAILRPGCVVSRERYVTLTTEASTS